MHQLHPSICCRPFEQAAHRSIAERAAAWSRTAEMIPLNPFAMQDHRFATVAVLGDRPVGYAAVTHSYGALL